MQSDSINDSPEATADTVAQSDQFDEPLAQYSTREKNSWVANASGVSLLAFLLSGAISSEEMNEAFRFVLFGAALIVTALISVLVTYYVVSRKSKTEVGRESEVAHDESEVAHDE